MKRFYLNRTVGAAVCSTGMVLLALATPSAATATTPENANSTHHGAREHRMHGPFFRAVHELKLTQEQRAGIRSILTASRQQEAARAQSGRPDWKALLDPGDPNHTLAVQAAQARAAVWVQQRSEIEASIYNLLTPDQRATLPTVLARMQTQVRQRGESHRVKSEVTTPG